MAATTLLAPLSSGKRTAICSAEAASVTPSRQGGRLLARGVVAERPLTVRHQRRGDLVGCEHPVRARPVGQQRARDGSLRLRVLRACRAVVFQQRVYLRGVVGSAPVMALVVSCAAPVR